MSEADFDEGFMDNLSMEALSSLTKERLRLLAVKINVKINNAMKKNELINVIGNHIGLNDDQASASNVVINEVEMARIELEREKLAFEMEKMRWKERE